MGFGREVQRFRTRKTGALLGYLCLHPERTHARDELAELLWPGCQADDGRSSLSTALWSLRRQLQSPDDVAGPVLLVDRYTVAVNPKVIETDAGSFLHGLTQASRTAAAHERLALLGAAVELYQGEVLAGYDEEWLPAYRREYQQTYESALVDLIGGLQATGRRAVALRYLSLARQADPDGCLCNLFPELHAGQPLPVAPELVAPPRPSALPEGTVTFLLAATEDDAGELPRLGAEVHRHQGCTVDGEQPFVAAFACAEDALACAAALQAGSSAGLRVALDTGRAAPELGRYFAPALDRAARLLLATSPGQAICSERTASLARLALDPGLRLADLGSHLLPGLVEAERLFQVGAAGALSVEPRPPVGVVAASGNLPRPLNRFCGREAELADLGARLTQGGERLVTLQGPGGSGKTRLALEVGNRLAEAYQGSLWFLPLAELSAPELVLPAVLRALGIPDHRQTTPVRQVAAHLGRRPALLLLDNAEHLLPGLAEPLEELVVGCPTVRCLVTSRSRLGIAGETVMRLSPLPLPTTEPSLAELSACACVRLFVDRAQAASPDFQLTAANASDIARLCVRLEGLPLALELAAAKTGTLTPAQLLARLTARVELVASPRDRRPARHRSLHLAVAGSVGQLPPDVLGLLHRLTACRGGWDLQAAEAVGDDGLAADHLAHLVDLSLVTVEVRPDGRRFTMLESLREHLGERLPAGEREATNQRHAEHYGALSREAGPRLDGEQSALWFARLDRELANVRAALDWLLDHRPEVAVASRRGFTRFLDIRGAWQEGRLWLARALAVLPPEAVELRGQASVDLGWFNYLLGDNEAAHHLTAAYVATCRRSGNRDGLCRSLYQASVVARAQGRLGPAEADLAEAAELARAEGGSPVLAAILHGLARHAEERGDYPRARALLDEALTLERAGGGLRGLANVLNRQAELAAATGDLDAARQLHEEAHAAFEEVGDRLALAGYGLVFGELSRRQGDPVEAERQFLAARDALREMGHLAGVASASRALARVAAEAGDRRSARLHLAECLRLNQQLGDRLAVVAALADLAAVEAEDDPDAALRALAAACRLGADAGHPLLDKLRSRLGEAAYAAAWTAGWEAARRYDSPADNA